MYHIAQHATLSSTSGTALASSNAAHSFPAGGSRASGLGATNTDGLLGAEENTLNVECFGDTHYTRIACRVSAMWVLPTVSLSECAWRDDERNWANLEPEAHVHQGGRSLHERFLNHVRGHSGSVRRYREGVKNVAHSP